MRLSGEATEYDPVPLDLWFKFNRAYQIFPFNLLLEKISMKSARDDRGTGIELVSLGQDALMCNRYHSPDEGYIQQYWRLNPRQLGLGSLDVFPHSPGGFIR